MRRLPWLLAGVAAVISNPAVSSTDLGFHTDLAVGQVDYNLESDFDGGFEDPIGARISLGLDFLHGKFGVEVFGQSFGISSASKQLSGQGVGDPGDVFTVDADASAYDYGFGGRVQLPIVGGLEIGGRAGLHQWHLETNESVLLRTARGQSMPISGQIAVNGHVYGGGEMSDDGIDSYVCLNIVYRSQAGVYAGAEFGYFPMSLTGDATADLRTVSLMVGYSR